MSTVSGISLGSNSCQNVMQSNWKQQQQEFQDMITALQSGNLTGAQQALTAVQGSHTQSVSQVGSAGQLSNQNNSILTDYNNLASALSSGDLTAAQQAFSSLQQDIQNTQNAGQVHHHHHHHHYPQNATASTGSDGSTSTTNGTTTNSISTTV